MVTSRSAGRSSLRVGSYRNASVSSSSLVTKTWHHRRASPNRTGSCARICSKLLSVALCLRETVTWTVVTTLSLRTMASTAARVWGTGLRSKQNGVGGGVFVSRIEPKSVKGIDRSLGAHGDFKCGRTGYSGSAGDGRRERMSGQPRKKHNSSVCSRGRTTRTTCPASVICKMRSAW
ncbi:hypothetical protein BJY52DRAFT_1306852 [Lactarius psammicola]|nr:hypothetical protein BJY52DRAFT_1306852 [Lactarius psammicola]